MVPSDNHIKLGIVTDGLLFTYNNTKTRFAKAMRASMLPSFPVHELAGTEENMR
jgi:hypothetical protein